MNKKTIIDSTGKSWLILCTAFSFMICVFAPLDIFLTNQSEFWFQLSHLLPVLLATFVAVAGVLYALSILMKRSKVSLYVYALFFSILIFFYIQGNFIPRNYGVLNGEEIQWSNYPRYAKDSIILFIITLMLWSVICLKVKEKIYTVGRYLGIILILTQLVTIATLYIQNNVLVENSTFRSGVVTDKDMFHLSENNNILVFVLDTFDSDDMKKLLERENSERYNELFTDFTFYPNTLGAYPTTKGAMPYLLTGVWYENEKPYTKYIEEAYIDNHIYNALKENKYSIGVYTLLTFLSSDYDMYLNVEEKDYEIANYTSFIKKIYQLVAFNYMPHQLKRYFLINTDDFSELKKSSTKDAAFSSDVQEFDRLLEEQGISITETGNCFRVYHLLGVHAPYTFGEELLSEDNRKYDVYDEAAGNCTLLSHFLKKLKENDSYDNTTIIIMADHGHVNYSQNPLFMIKNVKEKHEFKISEEKMSYEYFADMLISLTQGIRIDEKYVSDCQLDGKLRRFLYYSWDDSWAKQYLPSMSEMWADESVIDLIATERHYLSRDIDYSYELSNQITGNYTLGTELSFAKDHATANDFCLLGFSNNEENHTWTDRNIAKMKFLFHDDFENLLLKLNYSTYLSPERVLIYANDNLIEDYLANGAEEKEFIIPSEYIKEDELIITFEFPDAASPKSRGENSDSRLLGLAFKTLTISKID